MRFIDTLKLTIKNWMNDKNNDEWLFYKFIETEIASLDTSDAFSNINKIIPFLLDKENADVCLELFDVLISLVRKSDTTEIPEGLQRNWGNIKRLSQENGDYAKYQLAELAKYYRISD